jgi:hypothetical protein
MEAAIFGTALTVLALLFGMWLVRRIGPRLGIEPEQLSAKRQRRIWLIWCIVLVPSAGFLWLFRPDRVSD